MKNLFEKARIFLLGFRCRIWSWGHMRPCDSCVCLIACYNTKSVCNRANSFMEWYLNRLEWYEAGVKLRMKLQGK